MTSATIFAILVALSVNAFYTNVAANVVGPREYGHDQGVQTSGNQFQSNGSPDIANRWGGQQTLHYGIAPTSYNHAPQLSNPRDQLLASIGYFSRGNQALTNQKPPQPKSFYAHGLRAYQTR